MTGTGPTGLAALFAPRGIAVIGASASPGKLGAAMADRLASFPGPVSLINSRRPDRFLAGVADADHPVDLAVLCVPAAVCADALREAALAGARAALVCAGGFAEAGPAGEALAADLRTVIDDRSIRLLGPNTSGFFAPGRGLVASFVPDAGRLVAGRIAIVAASGGVNHALAFELAGRGHGLSLGVGIGAGLDVTAADVLDHLRTDPDTSAVALHLETVPDGPKLITAVRALASVKPVVALVVGRSAVADFAESHTGALATSWRLTRSALAQAGAVIVDDERDLVDAVGALSLLRLPATPAPGLALVTAQAGPGLLIADRAGADGIPLPRLGEASLDRIEGLLPPLTYQRNPVDTGRPTDTFGEIIEVVAADPAVDLTAIYALVEPDSVDLVDAATKAGNAPMIFGVGGLPDQSGAVRTRLIEQGVPAAGSPAELSVAIRAVLTDARQRAAFMTAATGPRLPPVPAGPLDETTAKGYLADLGIAVPAGFRCPDRSAAHAALDRIGRPVAVKLSDPAVRHKTELGGVRLDIRDHDQLERALAALPAGAAVLVEAMAEPGVDLIVGARRDPVFGPIVLLGLGGTWAETLDQVSLRLAPLDQSTATAMADELLGGRLAHPRSGQPALDVLELGRVISLLGSVITENPELTDLEINPLRLTRDGLIALDAVIITT